jgi:hypothetical protein
MNEKPMKRPPIKPKATGQVKPKALGQVKPKALDQVKPKTLGQADADEILPEYDFRRSAPNKYASRYLAGSTVVVLEPDVAAAFPSSGEANEALRALAGIILKRRSRRPALRRDF